MSKVSIIIPARNERYLAPTIGSLLTQARGDIEVLVFLEGPHVGKLPSDPRVSYILNETPIGMRPCTNQGADMATGDYLLKVDAHCIFAEGYDEALKRDCLENWLVVPTRHSIDQDRWAPKLRHYNYHVLTYPYILSMYGEGLHAITFDWSLNKQINAERAHLEIDDLMSFQGSCWFQPTEAFRALGPLDHDNFYFYQEAQEVGLRVWLTGGRCVVNKRTWYAHLHKGKDHFGADGRPGRGFYLDVRKKRASEKYATDLYTGDKVQGQTVRFVDFVERFWPLVSRMTDPRYAWPADWRDFGKYRAAFYARPEDQLPAHI